MAQTVEKASIQQPAGTHIVVTQNAQAQLANESAKVAQLNAYGAIANNARSLSQHVHGGLPAQLQSGIESLSGIAMNDVRVHYNSSKPAQLQAHAYALGSEIHLAPGQERHLPHEAWHVVQQKQGRVKPTLQLKGVAINDDSALEREADVMGERAMGGQVAASENLVQTPCLAAPIQRKISYKKSPKYGSKEALLEALFAIFPKEAQKEILYWVDAYEMQKGYPWASTQVFQMVIDHLSPNFKPQFAISSDSDQSRHGPQLPTRDSRSGKDDHETAMSSFNFSSVTLGRLTMWHGDEEAVIFHDRQVDYDFHAEDGLIEQFIDYLEDEENVINPRHTKINLTINNFFCSYKTTGKSKKHRNCLDRIIALQKSARFAEFHVYFKNTYGDSEAMAESIQQLQAVGIRVSSFTTEKGKAPYVSSLLDPHSDTEEGEEVDDYAGPRISSEDDIDYDLVQSVIDYMDQYDYYLMHNLLVVSGEQWTCYIRCVLHHFGEIDQYDTVMEKIEQAGLDTSSGVEIGSEMETRIRQIITNEIHQQFHVEVSHARYDGIARSSDTQGTRVYLLLTGAHFNLLR